MASNSLLDDNENLHSFQTTFHSLEIDVVDVRLQRQWDAGRASGSGEEASAGLVPVLWGRAKLQKDSLAVIGTNAPGVTELGFTLRPTDVSGKDPGRLWSTSEEWWKNDLEKYAGGGSDDDARLYQFLRNCFARFTTRPPTVTVGFSPADPEADRSDTWYTEAVVPESVFNGLATDILAGRCDRMTLRLELNPTLLDKWYAWVSEPVTLGLLPDPSRGAGAHAYGWIQSMTWDARTRDEATVPVPAAALTGASAPPAEQSVRDIERAFSQAAGAVAELSRRTTWGFVLVLVLITLVAVLR